MPLNIPDQNKQSHYQLWLCSLVDIEQLAPQYRHWLSAAEITKVNAYATQGKQQRALLVRIFVRYILSLYCHKLPQELLFLYDINGKPQLIQNPLSNNVQFNISHSGDYLLVGVSCTNESASLGVDIELIKLRTNINGISSHFFHPNEQSKLEVLPSALQRQYFFQLWCLKEARLKATGQGLSQSLASFEADVSLAEIINVRQLANNQLRFFSSSVSETHWSTIAGIINSHYCFALCAQTPIVMDALDCHWLDIHSLTAIA